MILNFCYLGEGEEWVYFLVVYGIVIIVLLLFVCMYDGGECIGGGIVFIVLSKSG